MPANTLIPLKEWLDRTALIGRTRSVTLKELDAAIGDYEKSPSDSAKTSVVAAFLKWKSENGGESGWRSSSRNQSKPVGAFTRLQALLAGDDDAAFGIAAPGQQAHHRHARLGVLYLFSQMSVSTNVFGMLLDTASGVASGAFNFNLSASTMLDSKVDSLSGIGKLGAQGGQKMLGAIEKRAETALGNAASGVAFGTEDPKSKAIVWTKTDPKTEQTLWECLKDFAQSVIDALIEKFGSLQTYASVITQAIKYIVTQISAQAGAFFNDAVTTLGGVDKMVKGFGSRLVSAYRMSSVKLIEGYPAAVVDAIHRSMTLSGLEGLVQTARGAGGIALNVVTAGAAQLASIIMTALDKLARIIWRCAEISEMKKVFATSRDEYKAGALYEKALAEGRQAAAPPLHARPSDFAQWFRKHATSVPALASLTLTTGICGDKMTYLAMFNDDGAAIKKESFIEQAGSIDALKPWGSDYLARSGYEFHTSDAFVAALLQRTARNAENLRDAGMNKAEKLYDRSLTALGVQTRGVTGKSNPNYNVSLSS
jgi:hypothetical protein